MPRDLPAALSLPCQLLGVFALGLMAGFFGTYSANVNLAMREVDGPTYTLVQSAFNRNVRHALFFACFFGPLLLGLGALLCAWASRHRAWWRLLAAVSLAYAAGIVVFTREVNLPLNQLVESWHPAVPPQDWATVRDAWNLANAWRALLSSGLFAAALAALVLRVREDAAAA